jgi:hypothetical protein
MRLLALLVQLSTPGSGSIFDPATPPLTVPIVLDDSLTGSPLTRGRFYAIIDHHQEEDSDEAAD